MLNKLALCRLGAHYFEKSKTQDGEEVPAVAMMYATTDGQFFHEQSKTYADSHASTQRGVTVIPIKKGDLEIEEAAELKREQAKEETAKKAAEVLKLEEKKSSEKEEEETPEAEKKTEEEAPKEEDKVPLDEMTIKELKVEVEALEGISEDDIEMVMKLSPKSKIASFIKSYEAPENEESDDNDSE